METSRSGFAGLEDWSGHRHGEMQGLLALDPCRSHSIPGNAELTPRNWEWSTYCQQKNLTAYARWQSYGARLGISIGQF
jgi:hypothetical protein